LEKHILTRSVMEPLANVDAQLNQFVVDTVRDVSKNWNADFESGRRALAIATITGTRYVVSSSIASGAFSFATDAATMLAEQKEQLKSLSVEGNNALATGLSFIPTLIRGVMHVILSEVPASFVTDILEYMMAVEKAPAGSYKSATTSNKEAIAKKWQLLRQSLCAVAWRAGYLLEKSLVAQYVQQSSAEKGATVKPGRVDPTVPSEDGGKKAKNASKDSDVAVPSAVHPYSLSFELDGVKKHLRALSETSAAAYWNAILKFSEFLDAAISKSRDGGADQISPADWKVFVRQSMRSAFEDSYSRMKTQFCNIAVDMIVQFISDTISLTAFGEVVRKTDASSKIVASIDADMTESLKINAIVDNVVSSILKPTVCGVVGEWKESALDRFHIVADTVTRAMTFQATEKSMGSSEAFDTRSLSLGTNSYSGSGSFTSDEDEPELEPEPVKEEPKPEPEPVKAAESASSASSSSKSSSHYSSVSGSAARSASGSRSSSRSSSASRSGSVSRSGSESGSHSGSESKSVSSKSSHVSEPEPAKEEPKPEPEPAKEEPKPEPEPEPEPAKEEPKPEPESEPVKEEPKPEPEPDPVKEEPKPEPEPEPEPEPAREETPEPEDEENTASEMSEIVPFDRM